MVPPNTRARTSAPAAVGPVKGRPRDTAAARSRLLRMGRSRDFNAEAFAQALCKTEEGRRAETLRWLFSEWVGLPLEAGEALAQWSRIERLFARMRARLGPPLSLLTVLLHHFSSREGLLRDPRLMAGSDLTKLRLSAITDPLTGLYNRRFLSESLSRHIFRASRSLETISVAILDLQDFKSINDRFGHRTGDRALIRTARVIRQSLRPADAPCRWGGDEFVLVLPQANFLVAVAVAERIRRRIGVEAPSIRAGLELDLYYGTASFPFDGRTAAELLAVADARLYQCREQWRFGGGGDGNRRRYPRFALDRMQLRLLAGGPKDIVAPVVNVGYGGLAFQTPGSESLPSRTHAELSQSDRREPQSVNIRVTHASPLPRGRVRVGCKYA